jgi:hypothetical protein
VTHVQLERYASGGNYTIELDPDGLAHVRVWRRTDVDSETGARFAEEQLAHLRVLARRCKGLVFDVRDAPPVVGPKTEAALGAVLELFAGVRKRTCFLVSANPVQQLQFKRLIASRGSNRGRVETDPETARNWALGRPG